MTIILIVLSIVIVFLLVILYRCKQELKSTRAQAAGERTRAESNNELKKVLALWLEERNKGKTLSTYFEERNMNRIAIYGMAELGKLLYAELKETNVKVVYGIDQKAERINIEIPVIKPSEYKEKVEAIIVTPVYYFPEIFDLLNKSFDGSVSVIGLDEIIYSIMSNEI